MRETSNELSKQYKQSKATQGGEMKVMKKMLKIALVMTMVVSMFAGVVSANTTTDLEKLQAAGVIIGGSGLNDNSTWVRQDVAVLLSRLYGLEATAESYGNTHGFTDVTNAYYHGFISWAKDEGYMVGRGNGVFGYGDTITAQEFATVLLRVIGINDYANAISNAASRGIMSAGTVGTAAITRGATYSSLVALLNQSVTGGGTLGGSLNLVGWTTNIVSIQLTTTEVDDDTTNQKLAFAVNGQSAAANLTALEDAGYTIEFQATKDVLGAGITDNNTGILDATQMTKGNTFEYKVVATHEDGTVIESDVQEVEIIDFSETPVSIDAADLVLFTGGGEVLLSSGKIASADTIAGITNVVITYMDGEVRTFKHNGADWEEIDENNAFTGVLQDVTLTSSLNTVALIGDDGNIRPVSAGVVVFTIEAGDASRALSATVVNGTRTATSAVVNKSTFKLVKTASDTFVATIVDQFLDPVQGFTPTFNTLQNSLPHTFATAAAGGATDNSGKTTITVTGAVAANNQAGSGTLQIKNGTTVLSTVSVAVSNDANVASYAFALKDSEKNYSLDLFADKDDESVRVIYNTYNAAGFLIGGYAFTAPGVAPASARNFSTVGGISVTDAVYADGELEITATAAGTGQLVIKEGSVVRHVLNITVVDTTPSVTGATFVAGAKIDEAGEYKLSNVLSGITGTGGVALYAHTDGKIYTKKNGQGVEVGNIVILESTTNGLTPTIAAGAVATDPVIKLAGNDPAVTVPVTKGTLVVRVNNKAGNPVAVVQLLVDVE